MKKIFKCFVLGMVLLCCVQSPIFASDVIENQKQYDTIVEEVFQDGSYLESYVVVSEHAEVFRSSKKQELRHIQPKHLQVKCCGKQFSMQVIHIQEQVQNV